MRISELDEVEQALLPGGLHDRQQAARRFLDRPEVKERITAAAQYAYSRKLRIIAASDLPEAAMDRRADAAEAACLTLMRSTMRSVAQLYVEAGEASALRFLDFLPRLTGAG